jgi:glycosyltransferase involved in cell wall biosynthesis
VSDPADFTCLLTVCPSDEAAHFAEAVESIALATLRPAEVLICQDGDLPDVLRGAVDAAAARLGARSVRNPGPRGLHHNLNHALDAVRTPWIARCDADDINAPDRFLEQVEWLRAHPETGVLGCDLTEFFPDGRMRRKPMPADHEAILAWAAWRNPVNHNTVFCRTVHLRNAGGYPDVPYKEDYALWLRLLDSGVKFANLPRPLVRARLGEGFYGRRANLESLRGEWRLYRLRRGLVHLGGATAALACAMRSAALAAGPLTRLIYESGLRR